MKRKSKYSYAQRKAYWQGFGYALGTEGRFSEVFGRSLLKPNEIAKRAMNGQSAAIENKKKKGEKKKK